MSTNKIKLPHLIALGQKFTISPKRSEITYGMEVSFSSKASAHAFYEQFFEKFIRTDESFKDGTIMDVEIPRQSGSTWTVTCIGRLNEKNNFANWIPTTPIVKTAPIVKKEILIKDEKLSSSERDELNALYYDKWQYILERWAGYFDFPPRKFAHLFNQKPELLKHPTEKDAYEYSYRLPVKHQIKQNRKNYLSPRNINPRNYSSESQTYSLGKTQFTCALGFPGKDEKWPARRPLSDYFTLLTVQTEETLRTKKHANYYLEGLSAKPKIIELGAGAGYAANDTRKLCPNATIVVIGTQRLSAENRDSCDQIYYGIVPDNTKLLKDHCGTADRVIDVFGPGTYAKNPIHALIYAAFLLKEGGKFFGIVSGLKDPHDFDACPLGTGKNRMELVLFFQEHLGITLSIEKTKVESKVEPGKIVEDFCINFTKTSDAKHFMANDFISLCELADKIIGTPAVVRHPEDNFGKYDDYSIEKLHYINSSSSYFKKSNAVFENNEPEVNKITLVC